MTIQDLTELIIGVPYKDKQVVFTLGYKRFRLASIEYLHGDANPVEIKLEEVKE